MAFRRIVSCWEGFCNLHVNTKPSCKYLAKNAVLHELDNADPRVCCISHSAITLHLCTFYKGSRQQLVTPKRHLLVCYVVYVILSNMEKRNTEYHLFYNTYIRDRRNVG